jgi:hypothetical protein
MSKKSSNELFYIGLLKTTIELQAIDKLHSYRQNLSKKYRKYTS